MMMIVLEAALPRRCDLKKGGGLVLSFLLFAHIIAQGSRITHVLAVLLFVQGI